MIALVSSISDTDIEREEAKANIGGYTRATFSEMCRVSAGAGNVDATLRTLVLFFECLLDIEGKGTLTKLQIQNAFKAALQSWMRDLSGIGEDDPAQDIQTIARGSLRLVASELVGNRTQASNAEHLIYDGLIAIEQIRAKNAIGRDAWVEQQEFNRWRASRAYRKWKANGCVESKIEL